MSTPIVAKVALISLLFTIPVWAKERVVLPSETGEIVGIEEKKESEKGVMCTAPSQCVAGKDMYTMVQVLKSRKCQLSELPRFELDPIQIVVDKQGRIFSSGADPKPYSLKMAWCDITVKAEGRVEVVTAMKKPPIWGFRFRPKAYMGLLPLESFHEGLRGFSDLTDAGFMIDFLYYDWANLNAAVGYRSVGGGVGLDLTENFGLYGGYGIAWGSWNHNVNLSLTFSFWNP
jgi:hypothetical protein